MEKRSNVGENVDKTEKSEEYCGEVTVFLTLLLLILLSLFGAAIQSARYYALECYSEENLQLGLEGLFSQYARPLWDDYHLFMLEEQTEADYLQEIKKYRGDMEHPFFKVETENLSMEEMIYFLGDQGENLRQQMISYMKYKVPENLFLNQSDKLEEEKKQKETVVLINDQIALADTRKALDETLEEIIWLIEGIKIKDGKLKTQDYFIKMLSPKEITQNNVGVHNDAVWEKLKSNYRYYEEMPIPSVRQVVKMIPEAINKIDELEIRLAEANNTVKTYQKKHASIEEKNLNEMGKEVLKGVQETETNYLENGLKKYERVLAMKEQLLENQMVLRDYLSIADTEDAEEAKKLLKNYKIRNLVFEYGDVLQEKKDNPVKVMASAFSDGILGLLMDDVSKLSTEKIELEGGIFGEKPDDKKEAFDQRLKGQKDTKLLEGVFETLEVGQKLDNLKTESFGKLEEEILENAYYKEHFSCFTTSEKDAPVCELEYVIAGGNHEKEALSDVLNRILLERSAANFAYLFTRSDIRQKAEATALVIAGITGMEALVELTKLAILYAFALEEAVIDIAILLEGKSIPMFPDEKSFLLSYEEILVFNRELVKSKSAGYQGDKNFLSRSYEDYLDLFLYLQKKEVRLEHAAGVIQKNIRKKYRSDFSLITGICGVKVNAEYGYRNCKTIKTEQAYGY